MTSQITKDFQMKSKLRKLADGGSRGEGGGLSKEAVMAAIAAQRGTPTPAPAPAPVAVQRPGGDYIRNPRSVLDARERAAGLADGGSVPFGSRGLSGLRDLIPQMEAMGFRQQPAQPDPTGLRAVMPRVKAMGYMDGGRVEGPGGRTDDEVGPVMLSDEEYVLPGDTADAIGRDKLDAIRLATHEFKDERKESALRGRTDDVPVDHLADGGNPWIVDSKGTVRPNAFGDAAAGPGYQQPRLPPPQPGTAVQVGQPPMGQRPPIDITPPGSRTPPAAQVVDAVTDVTPKTAMSRAGSALRGAARVGAPVAGIAGAAQSFDDQSTGYRDHFQNSVGAETPLGSVAADAARVLSNVGDAATFGVAGRLGRGVAGALGGEDVFSKGSLGEGLSALGRNAGRFVDGFLSPSDRDTFEQNRMNQAMGGGASGTSPVTAAASALRSDQGPAQPVTPGSYQSRRLSEMGVPLDVQNSKPIVGADLRTGGTDQYQNLGTYGGNGNIYGKADDPSRPGRINNFVGVGAGASPANEANGSGSGSGAYGAIQSALRNAGSGTAAPRSSGPTMSVIGGDDAWYEKVRKDILSSGVSQGYMNDQLVQLASIRAGRDNNRDTNAQNGINAQINADTLRNNAELNARVQMADALGRMEQDRATISSQTQAAQLKALQDAQKYADERQDKGAARSDALIEGAFTTTGKDGERVTDYATMNRFQEYLGSGKVMHKGRPYMSLNPQERAEALPDVLNAFRVNKAMNEGGGFVGGGRTSNSPSPLRVREADIGDLVNGLGVGEYLGSKFVPGYAANVVERTSDRKVRSVEQVAGDDLERRKAILRNLATGN